MCKSEKLRKQDLPTLRLSLLDINHLFTFFNSLFKVFSNEGVGLPEKNIVVSSANRKNLRSEEELVMSFMYMRKSRGPRTLPWGTPHLM